MKTSEPTIDFSWDMLNFPGSKFKGFLFQRFVYPQVELFRSKLGSCMAGFQKWDGVPNLGYFLRFRDRKTGIIFIDFNLYVYIYTYIEILWTVGASMAFF